MWLPSRSGTISCCIVIVIEKPVFYIKIFLMVVSLDNEVAKSKLLSNNFRLCIPPYRWPYQIFNHWLISLLIRSIQTLFILHMLWHLIKGLCHWHQWRQFCDNYYCGENWSTWRNPPFWPGDHKPSLVLMSGIVPWLQWWEVIELTSAPVGQLKVYLIELRAVQLWYRETHICNGLKWTPWVINVQSKAC